MYKPHIYFKGGVWHYHKVDWLVFIKAGQPLTVTKILTEILNQKTAEFVWKLNDEMERQKLKDFTYWKQEPKHVEHRPIVKYDYH